MRQAARVLLVAVVLPMSAAAGAGEGPGEIYEPPRTEVGEGYRERARRRGIAVDARTLSADAPLTLRPPALRFDLATSEGAFRALAWLIVVGAGVLVVVALLRARFGDLLRREDAPAGGRPAVVEFADVGRVDLARTRLSDLLAMEDPREALRVLLVMALARAAEANGIALRRSLTARDVLAHVPEAWRMREALEALVRRAELVLFGGRPFERADLAPLVEAARPMVGERRR